jgi:ferredoxin-NADP reductase
LGNSIFKVRDRPMRVNKLGLIAAGSGITPMF